MEAVTRNRCLTATFRITDTDIFQSLLEANRKMIEDERVPSEYKEQIKQIVEKERVSK